MTINVQFIAAMCHEANRLFCESIGDHSQVPWDVADPWQQSSAVKGVEFRLANPNASPTAQHEAWMTDKIACGWVYGEVKDVEKKTHPCLVKYDALPAEQRFKDTLFVTVVDSLKQLL